MKIFLFAALIGLAAACRKPPTTEETAPAKAVVAGERLIDFDEQDGAFACRAPAAWKAVEDNRGGGPLVMFMGPADGPRRGTAAISVTRYPSAGDRITTPAEYLDMLRLTDSRPSPLETRRLGDRTVYALHYETPQHSPRSRKLLYMNREDAVLIPRKEGFFLLSHTAPADAYERTLPIFEAVVRSFRTPAPAVP